MSPRRTCVGCRDEAASDTRRRIAATKSGSISVGPSAPGRGAWVCSADCFDLAVKREALARALRCDITNTEVERLRARLFEQKN